MLKEVNGDLLEYKANILCHQVNCCGVMGAGIAKQIKEKLLSKEQFERYRKLCSIHKEQMLGNVTWATVSADTYIANLFAEVVPTGKGVDTNYEALRKCLERVEQVARLRNQSVAIPGYIGCGLAGGNWTIVLHDIIIPIFKDSPVDTTIVYYDKDESKASLDKPKYSYETAKQLLFDCAAELFHRTEGKSDEELGAKIMDVIHVLDEYEVVPKKN